MEMKYRNGDLQCGTVTSIIGLIEQATGVHKLTVLTGLGWAKFAWVIRGSHRPSPIDCFTIYIYSSLPDFFFPILRNTCVY